MMGVRTSETCLVVNKRQVINWRDCCIWLVNLFELYDEVRTYNFKNNLFVVSKSNRANKIIFLLKASSVE
jgi:hypothetical protein